jgi:hypothetical protein
MVNLIVTADFFCAFGFHRAPGYLAASIAGLSDSSKAEESG